MFSSRCCRCLEFTPVQPTIQYHFEVGIQAAFQAHYNYESQLSARNTTDMPVRTPMDFATNRNGSYIIKKCKPIAFKQWRTPCLYRKERPKLSLERPRKTSNVAGIICLKVYCCRKNKLDPGSDCYNHPRFSPIPVR